MGLLIVICDEVFLKFRKLIGENILLFFHQKEKKDFKSLACYRNEHTNVNRFELVVIFSFD